MAPDMPPGLQDYHAYGIIPIPFLLLGCALGVMLSWAVSWLFDKLFSKDKDDDAAPR